MGLGRHAERQLVAEFLGQPLLQAQGGLVIELALTTDETDGAL